MSEQSKTARIQPSWGRRQWLKILAIIDDHPKVAIFLAMVVLGGVLFYAMLLGGLSHFFQSAARWRVESFGGTLHVDRAVRTPDVLLSFRESEFNRLDALVPTATHFGGTAFRAELRAMVDREDGLIRVGALDPRLSDPDHPQHKRFTELAEAFGMSDYELEARCWYSTAVLLCLEAEFGAGIEIRLIEAPVENAQSPYFCLGRSGHLYYSDGRKGRLDVIVPRPEKPTGSDSFTNPGMIIKNRPKDDDVVRFNRNFDSMWEGALELNGDLRDQFLDHLNGN